jgi:hypothetical protein
MNEWPGNAVTRLRNARPARSSASTVSTTTDFVFDCPSAVAKSCVLVLVHPHPPLCAGAYYWIRITDVSIVPSDDGVFPTVYNPRHIQLRAQRRKARKSIHHLSLMNTAVAPAAARVSLLGKLEELVILPLRLHRECYLCVRFSF